MPQLPQPLHVCDVLALADDTAFAIELSNLVFYREAAIGFTNLSDAEKTAFLIDGLEREVNNGGFAQFFFSSVGDHARAAPAALRTINAPQMAGIVDVALAAFGPEGPSPDRAVRQDQLELPGEAAQEVWSDCDNQFWDYPENLAALLRRFVADRVEEFGPPRQLRQLVGIHPISLVALPPLPPPITHHYPIDQRYQQIVQPLRLCPLLKSDVYRPAHTADELHQRRLLRRQDGPRTHPTPSARTEATVVAWCTSNATYLVMYFMRAAPCCDPQVLDKTMVAARGALSTCVRQTAQTHRTMM